jgi:hypothetical protein
MILKSVFRRRFFVSKEGYMGLGPQELEEGDVICVLAGCNVPVLLRKENDHYVLVGECFVWGLTDGEAVKDGTEGVDWETICLE